MRRSKWTIMSVGVITAMLAVLVIFFFVSRRPDTENVEIQATVTPVDEVLARNLEKNYPPSPKEVVIYFSEITKCFFNEQLSEAQLKLLGEKIQGIYDDELIANQTQDQYMRTLASDVGNANLNEYKISSYNVSSSTDVEYFSEDGFEFARLYCTYTIRKGTNMGAFSEHFLLRKDGEGHWKIYGWKKENL